MVAVYPPLIRCLTPLRVSLETGRELSSPRDRKPLNHLVPLVFMKSPDFFLLVQNSIVTTEDGKIEKKRFYCIQPTVKRDYAAEDEERGFSGSSGQVKSK